VSIRQGALARAFDLHQGKNMPEARSFCMRLMPAILFLAAVPLLAFADDADDIITGRGLAELNCSKCHSIEATGDSPFKPAPPFRSMHGNYVEGELEDAFNDGIVVAHPAMPDWNMNADQARALAAYIMQFGRAKEMK
jgi:mono/diheme cytochrome c family protein